MKLYLWIVAILLRSCGSTESIRRLYKVYLLDVHTINSVGSGVYKHFRPASNVC